MLITDEGENTVPYFRTAWSEYQQEMQVAPSVLIVKAGGSPAAFERGLQEQGIEMTAYQFEGDAYALPNLLPLLAMPSKAELVGLIMQYALPERPASPVEVEPCATKSTRLTWHLWSILPAVWVV